MSKTFNSKNYLDHCINSKLVNAEELAVIGVVIILLMSVLDLALTMYSIYTGPFQDSNPIAQFIIDIGVPEGLVLLKAVACVFFAWVCIKHKDLLLTQVGVGFACFVHFLLMFYWAIVF